MDKWTQIVTIDNSNMLPKWANQGTTKTVQLPLNWTFTGKRSN
jgi:hypothetical protein